MGTNDREDSEEQDQIRWEGRFQPESRTVNKSYESEARFREERQQERDEYEAALEELEKIGWPCRLRELPEEYVKLQRELLAALARCQSLISTMTHCRKLIMRTPSDKLTTTEVEVNQQLCRAINHEESPAPFEQHPRNVVVRRDSEEVRQLNLRVTQLEQLEETLEARVDRLEERAMHGVREVMDGELCCEHYSPEKCGCKCEDK